MMQNYQNMYSDQNLKSLFIFEGVRVEKLKGGLTRLRFWSLAIKIICNNKSKIASLSVQPFVMKMKRTFYWSPTFYWGLNLFAEKRSCKYLVKLSGTMELWNSGIVLYKL